MTKVHGAHRQRQQVVPPRMTALERERQAATKMWAHETTEAKTQRLIEANKESMAWVKPENRKE